MLTDYATKKGRITRPRLFKYEKQNITDCPVIGHFYEVGVITMFTLLFIALLEDMG
jgi:hypothetical protein